MYHDLRKMALRMTPKLLGLKPAPKADEPYGILMEMGLTGGVATLTSFASGDASLYYSTGGGVIGGVGHANVRATARRFVATAREYLPTMTKATTCPLPAQSRVRFYVLTINGIFTTEASENALGTRRSPLSPLFFRGQDIITELRLITEAGDRARRVRKESTK